MSSRKHSSDRAKSKKIHTKSSRIPSSKRQGSFAHKQKASLTSSHDCVLPPDPSKPPKCTTATSSPSPIDCSPLKPSASSPLASTETPESIPEGLSYMDALMHDKNFKDELYLLINEIQNQSSSPSTIGSQDVQSHFSSSININNIVWEGVVSSDFEILEKLRVSPHETNYKAEHVPSGLLVLIKSTPVKFDNVDVIKEVQASLQQEIKALRSPHLVCCYGCLVDEDNHAIWLLSEYCDFGSILDVMKRLRRPLSEKEIASLMRGVLLAVHFLHDKEVALTHGDIKASNIMMDTRGFVKLGDFGAGIAPDSTTAGNNAVLSLGSQIIAGSPFHTSPEQCRDDEVTHKSDIWSLGITALELAESKPPHHDESTLRVLSRISRGDNRRTFVEADKWSTDFSDFVDKCLQTNPERRPESKALLEHPWIRSVEESGRSEDILSTMLKEAGLLAVKSDGGKREDVSVGAEGVQSTASSDDPSKRTEETSKSSVKEFDDHIGVGDVFRSLSLRSLPKEPSKVKGDGENASTEFSINSPPQESALGEIGAIKVMKAPSSPRSEGVNSLEWIVETKRGRMLLTADVRASARAEENKRTMRSLPRLDQTARIDLYREMPPRNWSRLEDGDDRGKSANGTASDRAKRNSLIFDSSESTSSMELERSVRRIGRCRKDGGRELRIDRPGEKVLDDRTKLPLVDKSVYGQPLFGKGSYTQKKKKGRSAPKGRKVSARSHWTPFEANDVRGGRSGSTVRASPRSHRPSSTVTSSSKNEMLSESSLGEGERVAPDSERSSSTEMMLRELVKQVTMLSDQVAMERQERNKERASYRADLQALSQEISSLRAMVAERLDELSSVDVVPTPRGHSKEGSKDHSTSPNAKERVSDSLVPVKEKRRKKKKPGSEKSASFVGLNNHKSESGSGSLRVASKEKKQRKAGKKK